MRPKAPPVLGQDWLTTPPIAKNDLVGRVSALVFWSAGCEASLSRLLEIEEMARRLPPALSVVAVHSPRFSYERERSVVEDIIARTGQELVIVHDPQLLTWARYSPGGWPATVLIDHKGRTIGASLGLSDLAPIEEATHFALLAAERDLQRGLARKEAAETRTPKRRKARANRSEKHLPVALPAPVIPQPRSDQFGMAWPSGVCVMPRAEDLPTRLAIADSGNGRLLIIDLAGDRRSADVVLSLEGLDAPGKLCALDASNVAVSLPSSGSVVALDLENADSPVKTLTADLERPQGLTLDQDGSLVVADAGDNQLLRITSDGTVGVIAGSFLADATSEGRDGPASRALLNQPVDVVRTATGLAFLDAATSNLRMLDDKGTVRTITSNNFQHFGLVDGPAHRASLQRPTALALLPDGALAIADTGNSRLRTLDNRNLKTLGLAGLRLPEDLVVLDDGQIIVADTGNHRLLVVDPAQEQAWELQLNGLPPVLKETAKEPADETSGLSGTVNSRVVADVPYVGEGPWTVEIHSDPGELVEPIELRRHERHPVSVALAEEGVGELHIESAGPHASERTWWRRPLTVQPREN